MEVSCKSESGKLIRNSFRQTTQRDRHFELFSDKFIEICGESLVLRVPVNATIMIDRQLTNQDVASILPSLKSVVLLGRGNFKCDYW